MADADLRLLLDVAAEAGRIALRYFRQDPEVWWKEGNSPVSEADLAVDAFLKETLLAARPDYGWLSEETAPKAAASGAPERFFVVDPIDGTRAFLRGEDTWCVALAVVVGGRPVAAAIDAPAKREVFEAAAGAGAALNGRPLEAPRGADADGMLRVAMPDALRRRLAPEALRSVRAAVSAPSLAYRIAQVAAGRLDGTLVRPSANDWDIAAADLILAEAGGLLGDVEGEERLYKIEGRRHGLLIAGATPAWPELQRIARSASA
jgi:myo-inositol-1(or 4)-monophosphatase